MLNFLFTKTPLFLLTQSFWRDEAFSYLLAKRNIWEILTLTAHDFNPPFYYLTLHFWMKIFGHSEIALRSLSLIFYWATIYMAFLFLHEVFNIGLKKSFAYLTLFIISPILVRYAFEARMYTMFAFFATLSFFAFYKKNKRLHLLSTIAGLYTHYFMVFVIMSQAFYIFLDKKHNHNIKGEIKLIAWSFVAFIPWILFLLVNKPPFAGSFWIEKTSLPDLLILPVILYTGLERNYSQITNAGFGTFLFLILLSFSIIYLLYAGHKKQKKISYFFSTWVFAGPLMIFIISFFKPLYFPRYMIFATPGLILFAVTAIEQLAVKTQKIILVLIVFITIIVSSIIFNSAKKSDTRTTYSEIKKLSKADDLIYVSTELDYFTAVYYAGEKNVYIYGKNYNQIPNYVGKVLIPENKLKNTLPTYPARAFIVRPDGQYDIQAAL